MIKILIADDEIHLRFLIEHTIKMIEDEEISIFTAADGDIAISEIKRVRPDLVFLDIMMPKKDGYDICSEIKNDPALKDTFVIILTAKGQEIDRVKGKEAGADLFMTKPFNPDEIIKKTREIIESKR